MNLLTKMILRRLLVSVLVLFVVSLLVFAATLLLPGDPARAILGQQATPERVAALTAQLGLDQPVWERYLAWLGGVLTGDLGYSAATQGPVTELLGGRIAASAVLLVLTAVVATPVALALGAWAAVRRGTRTDSVLSGTSLVLAALPEFVIGVLRSCCSRPRSCRSCRRSRSPGPVSRCGPGPSSSCCRC